MISKLWRVFLNCFTDPRQALMAPTDDTMTQSFRALALGVLATILDVGLYQGLLFANVPTWICIGVGYVAGTVLNFALSNIMLFQKPTAMGRKVEFLLFCGISAVGFFLNQGIILGLVRLYPAQESNKLFMLGAKLIATLITFAWTFGARKWGVYRNVKNVSDPSNQE